MEKEYSISESEWEVMKVLWKNPNRTMSFIVEQLEGRGWSYSTIKTFVKRLTDKEFVVADKSQGKNFLYKCAVKEQECKINETKNFLAKVFDNSLSMFVSTLVKESNLSKKEKEELMNIINKMEEDD